MKLLVKGFLLVALFLIAGRFCHRQTDGFQTVKIASDLPVLKEWEVPSVNVQEKEQLKAIFSQPFTFLDSGGQCYAFLSQDGKLVLKLFKMHHLRQYPLLHRLHLPGIFDQWRVQFLIFQKQKLQRVFSSSKLAYTALKNETGLLYLNLNPSEEFKDLQVTLIDRIDIRHRVNLKSVPFVLQYRADNPFDMLRLHLAHKDLNSGKQVVKQIIDCLTDRYEKGIKDLDPALRRNIGLLKDRAIAIDIGSFFTSENVSNIIEKKQELIDDTRRMHRWLKKRSKELAEYLDTLVEEYSGGGAEKREKSNEPL